jgi:signal transduction histidine kinase
MHPALLAEHGVAAAIRGLAARAPVPVAVTDRVQRRLPSEVEAALYFTAAEAITNASKHARASRIDVALECTRGWASVEVADDGVGGAAGNGGTGLAGLQDRLAIVGGSLDVRSTEGAGTRVRARVPLSAEPDAPAATPS